MSDYSVIRIRQSGLSDRQWEEFYNLLRRISNKYHGHLFSPDWATLKKRVSAAFEQNDDFHQSVILREEGMVGWLELRKHGAEAPEPTYYTGFEADYESSVPDGFAAAAGAELARLAEPYAPRLIYTMTAREEMSRLAERWGGSILNRLDRYRLYRKDADKAVIERWRDEGARRNPDLTLITFTTIPDEHLERYCRLFATFFHDMPREHEESRPFHFEPEGVRRTENLQKAQGSVTFTVALLDHRGEMIAHTNGFFLGAAPSNVYQAMTGVSAGYRGRGLAKWLKAELFARIGELYPANESFQTEMRAINEPILAINRQMGYRLEGHGHEIAIDTEALRKFASGAV